MGRSDGVVTGTDKDGGHIITGKFLAASDNASMFKVEWTEVTPANTIQVQASIFLKGRVATLDGDCTCYRLNVWQASSTIQLRCSPARMSLLRRLLPSKY